MKNALSTIYDTLFATGNRRLIVGALVAGASVALHQIATGSGNAMLLMLDALIASFLVHKSNH